MEIANNLEELFKLMGFKKGDKIEVQGPAFKRLYEIEIKFIPKDKGELKALLETAPKEVLTKMGCGIWDSYEAAKVDYQAGNITKKEFKKWNKGDIHYLFPGEWINHIEYNTIVLCISGEKLRWVKGKMDDDIRFGCLAYGFMRNEKGGQIKLLHEI